MEGQNDSINRNVMLKSKVYLVRTDNRKEGVKRCLALFGPLSYAGKSVLLKPNFNTADPAPGSTHNDTMEQLLLSLQATAPATLTVGERSGPPLTADVLQEKGVNVLCQRLGVPIINYDNLSPGEWVKFKQEGLHWKDGFIFPKPVHDADVNVATCTLKTHTRGGVFSFVIEACSRACTTQKLFIKEEVVTQKPLSLSNRLNSLFSVTTRTEHGL